MNEWWKGSEVNDYRAGKKIYILSQESNFPNRFPRQDLKTERVCFQQCPWIDAIFYFCNRKGPWLTQGSLVPEFSIPKFPRANNPETPWMTVSLFPAHTCALPPWRVLSYAPGKHILEGGMWQSPGPNSALGGAPRMLYIVRNMISSWLHGILVSKELSLLSVYHVSLK